MSNPIVSQIWGCLKPMFHRFPMPSCCHCKFSGLGCGTQTLNASSHQCWHLPTGSWLAAMTCTNQPVDTPYSCLSNECFLLITCFELLPEYRWDFFSCKWNCRQEFPTTPLDFLSDAASASTVFLCYKLLPQCHLVIDKNNSKGSITEMVW